MLEMTLFFWKKKDRFVGLYSDFGWLACPQFVPAP